MNNLVAILVYGVLLIAAASVLALIVAINTAEDGYEDSSGYHRCDSSKSEMIDSTQ